MMNWSYYGLIKVNQEMAIFRFDLENMKYRVSHSEECKVNQI